MSFSQCMVFVCAYVKFVVGFIKGIFYGRPTPTTLVVPESVVPDHSGGLNGKTNPYKLHQIIKLMKKHASEKDLKTLRQLSCNYFLHTNDTFLDLYEKSIIIKLQNQWTSSYYFYKYKWSSLVVEPYFNDIVYMYRRMEVQDLAFMKLPEENMLAFIGKIIPYITKLQIWINYRRDCERLDSFLNQIIGMDHGKLKDLEIIFHNYRMHRYLSYTTLAFLPDTIKVHIIQKQVDLARDRMFQQAMDHYATFDLPLHIQFD